MHAAAARRAVASLQRGVDGFEAFMRKTMTLGKGCCRRTGASFAPTESDAAISGPIRPPAPPWHGCSAATLSKAPSGARNDPDKTQEMPAPNSVRMLHLLATLEAHDDFRPAAAAAFATELAEIFDCDRVSVGLTGRRHVKVEALSHSTEFKANQGLLRDIGAAMEETIWQGQTLLFPQPEGAQPRVDRAHAHAGAAPRRAGDLHGAAGQERPCRSAPSCSSAAAASSSPRCEVTLCENIGALLGPLIERQAHVDRALADEDSARAARSGGAVYRPGQPAIEDRHGAALLVAAGGRGVDPLGLPGERTRAARRRDCNASSWRPGRVTSSRPRAARRSRQGRPAAGRDGRRGPAAGAAQGAERSRAARELVWRGAGEAGPRRGRHDACAKLEEARAQLALVETSSSA